MQAKLLNKAHTDINIIVGLCVGDDIIFTSESHAPVTTLISWGLIPRSSAAINKI